MSEIKTSPRVRKASIINSGPQKNVTKHMTRRSEKNSISGIQAINDFVIKFANVNGTGSASANHMFAKSIFRMGIPVSPKNIFPSNIQGLPTWYEVRISEQGYLGRREGVDVMVSMNAQSMSQDVSEVLAGGYFVYDSSRPLDLRLLRNDVEYIGLPLTAICLREYTDPRHRMLFKNVLYVGALAALLNIEFNVLTELVSDQFKAKKKLIAPNIHALELGYQYANQEFSCPLGIRVERRDLVGEQILINGNTATGLGALYGGATVAAWYPITPSTSVVEAFEKYAKRLRIDPGTGKKNFAVIQAEDEIAAIGIAIGAGWNGSRAFTTTSGPGISLMSEFLGLAYFAELPVVLIDVQRAGPSTGMPTRSQHSDILPCAYASHGDTKHVLLFPSTPKECFDFSATAFDLAEQLQTPIIILSDLDLGMNDQMSEPLQWDDERCYHHGKVLDKEALDDIERFGRYVDVDGDGICYRTYPGTHPTKGAFFTRGTSRDAYAVYTEKGDEYVENVDRLTRKFETAKNYMPVPEITLQKEGSDYGLIYVGTSEFSAKEAMDILNTEGLVLDGMRIRAFPFTKEVEAFIRKHKMLFVVDQNRDGQLLRLLINECEVSPDKLTSILNYDGMPITASTICKQVRQSHPTVVKVHLHQNRVKES